MQKLMKRHYFALYAIMPFDVLPEAVLGIFGCVRTLLTLVAERGHACLASMVNPNLSMVVSRLADDALVFLVVAVTSANTIRQNFVQASQRAN